MPIQLGSAVGKIVLNSDGVRAGVTSAQGQLRSLEGTFNAVKIGIVAAGAAIVGSVAGLGGAAVKMAADYDRAMRNVNSIAKLPEEAFKKLEGQVIDLSTKLPQSAETLAKGLYDIQSSGFAGADALNVLEVSAKAASAGLTTTDVASKAVTAVLNAYGMGADQAGHVSDVLFKTVDRGVLTFEELATNIGDIVGTANVAGVSIEDLGAAMAAMTKGGISAAESATALNQLMLTYIQPSDDAKELAHQLGIEFSAQALQAKGLSGVMKELSDKVGLYEVVATGADAKIKEQAKSIDAQIRALQLQKTATQDSAKASKAAIDEQIRALEAQKRAISGNDDAAKAARKSLSDQIAALRDQKAGVTSSADAINRQIQALRNQKAELLASKDTNVDYNVVMTEMSKRTGLTAEQLAQLFPNVRALKAALSLTRGEGEAFTDELNAMKEASGATQRAFDEQAKATTFQFELLKNKVSAVLIKIGTAVLPILNKVMAQIAAALDSPQVKAAIDTLISVIESLGDGDFAGALRKLFGEEGAEQILDTLREVSLFLQTQVLPAFQQLIGWILTQGIPAFMQFVSFLQTNVLPIVRQVFGWIIENREQILGVLAGIVAGFATFQAISGIVGVITGIVSAVSAMSGVFTAAGGIIAGIVAILGGPLTVAILAIAAVVGVLVAAWVNNWGDIQGKTKAALEFIQGLITSVIGAIQQFWTEHGDQILAAWAAVWDAIQKAVDTALSIIRPIIDAFMAALDGDWYRFGQNLRVAWDNAWKAIQGILSGAISILIGLAQQIISGIWNAFTATDWGALGRGIIDGIVAAISGGIEAVQKAAESVASAALEAAKGFLGIHSPSSEFEGEVGEPIVQGMVNGITASATAIKTAMTAMAQNMLDVMQKTIVLFKEATAQWMIGMHGAIVEGSPRLLEVLRQLVQAIQNVLVTARPVIVNIVQGLLWEILNVITQWMGQVRALFEQVVQLIVSVFQSMPWQSVGLGIAYGIAEGINAGSGAIIAAAQAAAQAALNAAKAELQIASPSRKFLGIGRATTDGFALGIMSGVPAMQRALRDDMDSLRVTNLPTLYNANVLPAPAYATATAARVGDATYSLNARPSNRPVVKVWIGNQEIKNVVVDWTDETIAARFGKA